jgi:drug/metabolite transporter (DMT)-like permease
MDTTVFIAVLIAAACHAGWNAVIKLGLEPFTATALIAIAAGLVALPLAPFVGLPAPASWPWLFASVLLHVGYYIGLTEAYRAGDMGQVYPIARGTAPLLTATVSTLVLGEALGLTAQIGIAVLAAGVFLISLRGGHDLARLNGRAVAFALFTSLTICGYSLVDGIGARLSGNPHGYAVGLFVGDAIAIALLALLRRGPAVARDMVLFWKPGFAGGALSLASYWIAIWAMTLAPIAIVAALRETSVLFGAVIAVVVLCEPLRANRIVAAVMIVSGLMLIRLS